RQLRALEQDGGGPPAVDPSENARERPSEPRIAIDRQRAPEPIEEARQAVRTRPPIRGARTPARRRASRSPGRRTRPEVETPRGAPAGPPGQAFPPGGH